MADTEHVGGKIANYTVTNPGRGGRFVNNPSGGQVSIPAKGQVTTELTDAEVKSIKARGDLEVTKAPTSKAAAAAAPAPEPKPGEGDQQQDDGDKAVAYVAHESFGNWYGYNAAGEKVDGAGPWKKDEAQTWATDNKAEVRTGAAS